MKKPTVIGRLDYKETARLEKDIAKVAEILGEARLKQESIKKRLQTDLRDVYVRKSIACPYEIQRAQRWCRECLPAVFEGIGDPCFVTLGRPTDRREIGDLSTYDPENLFRKFTDGIHALKGQGIPNIRAFYVLEIGLCQPLDAAPFYEPHLHAIVQGASAEQLRKTLRVRKSQASTYRNRSLQIKRVKNLTGLIGYCTKLNLKLQNQHENDDDIGWGSSRFSDECLREWTHYMSHFSPGEMLKFVGINGHELMQPLTAELSLDLSETRHGRR